MKLDPVAIYCSSGSWGGLEMNTARLARWLFERGQPVTLFCLKGTPMANQASTCKIPIHYIRRNKRYLDFRGAFWFSRHLACNNISSLILVDNRDLDFGGLVKLFSCQKIRLIYQQHMRLGITKKDLIHTLRFRQLDAWITLLPYMKEEILSKTRFPENRIHLIPLGLDVASLISSLPSRQTARKQLDLPVERFIIGILGRLDPQKGQHLVIQALYNLRQKGITCSLLVMGETTLNEGIAYTEQLHKMISGLGLRNDVFFRGYQDDIAVFYAAIDLFALGSFEETYGMVSIEAMLCGVPVVGSRAGGTTELLGNGTYGWLYTPKDPSDMATVIHRAIGDREILGRLTAHAREHASSVYSHHEECSRIEHLLQSLSSLKK